MKKNYWYQASFYLLRGGRQEYTHVNWIAPNKRTAESELKQAMLSGQQYTAFEIQRVGTHDDYMGRYGVDGQNEEDQEWLGQEEVIDDSQYWGEWYYPSAQKLANNAYLN